MNDLTVKPAYHRRDDGTLERIEILISDGLAFDIHGFPLTKTGEELTLTGWPHDECLTHRNEGGREIYVPSEHFY